MLMKKKTKKVEENFYLKRTSSTQLRAALDKNRKGD